MRTKGRGGGREGVRILCAGISTRLTAGGRGFGGGIDWDVGGAGGAGGAGGVGDAEGGAGVGDIVKESAKKRDGGARHKQLPRTGSAKTTSARRPDGVIS